MILLDMITEALEAVGPPPPDAEQYAEQVYEFTRVLIQRKGFRLYYAMFAVFMLTLKRSMEDVERIRNGLENPPGNA